MNFKAKKQGKFLVGVFLLIFLFGFSQMVHSGSEISVDVGQGGIYAISHISGGNLIIRVSGPEDFFDEQQGYSQVNWLLPARALDGFYNFDVFLKIPGAEEGDQDQLYREHGSFEIEHGQIIYEPPVDLSCGEKESSWVGRLAKGLMDWLVPSAYADDVLVQSTYPSLSFDDTDNNFPPPPWGATDWKLSGAGANIASSGRLILNNMRTTTPYLEIQDAGANGLNSLVVEGDGDISFADGSVFLDRSSVNMGIGTVNPMADIHIVDVNPVLRLETILSRWDINNFGDLFISNSAGTGTPVTNFLVLDADLSGDNHVGIFKDAPEATLHVSSPNNNGTARVLVKEENSTAQNRLMFELVNNGGPQFVFRDTDRGEDYQFSLLSNGFVISRLGTGGPEFALRDNGEMAVGPGPTTNLLLDSAGNLNLAGTVNASSSREVKENMAAVNTDEILAKLCELPVMTWNYKKEDAKVKHLGPMAEDFHALFDLGKDEKHLSPQDLAGVAVAAVKGLKDELAKKDARVKELESEIKALKGTVENFKKKVANLENKKEARISELEDKLRSIEIRMGLAAK